MQQANAEGGGEEGDQQHEEGDQQHEEGEEFEDEEIGDDLLPE